MRHKKLLHAAGALMLAMYAAPTLADDAGTRLSACLQLARDDPAAAVAQAGSRPSVTVKSDEADALQCLGTAQAGLGMWAQAQASFMAAAKAALAQPDPDARRLFALQAQAGNAALETGDAQTALYLFNAALAAMRDVAISGNAAAALHVDRARALAALSRTDHALAALTLAQLAEPRDSTAFLLEASLARRADDLARAAIAIAHADAITPGSPDILLEGGLIAAAAGNDRIAANAWRRIVEHAPDASAAPFARTYLEQLQAARSASRSAGKPANNALAGADPDWENQR
ncbi:hypothetical protein RM533_08085 [Croceicoccus sp. F390]|uniref:Tetratricopeptide repeat protein n=1 Tax=Croceicoccus esteveae TaxID=3075597 RepID=A0ABU2ZHR1_9SPHN|nr:hypothetical protein [Croceicoccus sp. F390]MDT0576145.1 hypothetical protein [Croceicoccus sp. F390]